MQSVKQVGIVGAGLIGQSWSALCLARGLDVILFDPRPEAEAQARLFAEQAWPMLRSLNLATSEQPRRARFTAAIEDLGEVDFIQENGPDRLEVKQDTVRQLELHISPDVIIASGTSSLLASDIQQHARGPQRILVAHPMNPPHAVPLVELVAGQSTSEQALAGAEGFYQSLERVTIRVQQEVVGHLANRLTAALYREAVHIAAQGIASIEDIDKAIAYGPGMRWALMGPHLIYHLGGGPGGYRHYLDHLGPTQEARWQHLGTPKLTDEVKQLLIDGMQQALEKHDSDSLLTRRDEALAELFSLKKKHGF